MKYVVENDEDMFLIYKEILDSGLYLPIDYLSVRDLTSLMFAVRRALDIWEKGNRKTPVPRYIEEAFGES